MAKGSVRVICGPGTGKSASALGYAMMGIFQGKKVIMVQFLKGVLDGGAMDVLKKLEPTLLIGMAVIAGYIILAVYIAMFQMYSVM